MGHDAVGIGRESPLKAFHSFLLIEAEAPIQTEVEPTLRFRSRRRDRPGVRSEVKRIFLRGLAERARWLLLRRSWQRRIVSVGSHMTFSPNPCRRSGDAARSRRNNLPAAFD